jgi:hypothetical protein
MRVEGGIVREIGDHVMIIGKASSAIFDEKSLL